MPLNLRAILERFNRDRRRLTPRVVRVEFDGEVINVVFDRNMDQRQPDNNIHLRVFSSSVSRVVDFNMGYSWQDVRTLNSSSSVAGEGYSGPDYMVILDEGNLRARGRFKVQNHERCDNVVTF